MVMEDESEHSNTPTKSPSALSAMNDLLTSLRDQVQRGDNSNTGLECSICTELFMTAVTLSCSHTFCECCITQWLTEHKGCPMCRTPIKLQTPTVLIDKLVDKVLEKADEMVRTRREELRAERKKLMHAISAPVLQNFFVANDAYLMWTNEWLPGIF